MIEVKNFPKKLWRGEYSLPITYWVFNALIENLILGRTIALILTKNTTSPDIKRELPAPWTGWE
jgi:hypothetical protein